MAKDRRELIKGSNPFAQPAPSLHDLTGALLSKPDTNQSNFDYVTLTNTGIEFRREINHEEWQALGHYIRERVDGYQWAIGDFINAGKNDWGNYYDEAIEITGYSKSSLEKFSWVAAGFESFRRRKNLTYSHHVEALMMDNADEWLDLAEQENLSVRALREAMKPEVLPAESTTKPSKLPARTTSLFKAFTAQQYNRMTADEQLNFKQTLEAMLRQVKKWDNS